ncbi:MAG: VWA domain-containing protein [Alsobacter sp.]
MSVAEAASWAAGPWSIGPVALLRPLWLLGLIPLALVAWRASSQSGDDWVKACDPQLLAFLRPATARRGDARRRVALALAVLVVLALAAPARLGEASPRLRNAAGLVLVVDVSPSMAGHDPPPGRLAAAQAAAAEVTASAGGRQVAVVVFSGDAYVLSPFTTDTAVTLSALDGLEVGLVPEKGSRPGAGLLLARSLLDGAGIEDGEILLLGDGGGVDAAALAMACAARVDGHRRVGAILAGPSGGAPALQDIAAAGGARCACSPGEARDGVFARSVWDAATATLSASAETGRAYAPELKPILAAALLLAAMLLGRRSP